MSDLGNGSFSGYMREDHSMKIKGNPLPPLQPDPVQQAVDNYILMERKARAWDELARWLETDRAVVPWVLAKMDELMQSF